MVSWTAAQPLPVAGEAFEAPSQWIIEPRSWGEVARRAVPFAGFFLLAGFQALTALPSLTLLSRTGTVAALLGAASSVLAVAFSIFVAAVYLARGDAAAGDHRVRAFVLALYASFVLLAAPVALALMGVRAPRPGDLQLLVATVLMAGGMLLTLTAMAHLRRSFSLVPEARELVTGGPYGLVRHPVYLGEITTSLGLLLAHPSPWLALACATFVAAQVARMNLEERLLRVALPAYASWAATTRRLIPGLY